MIRLKRSANPLRFASRSLIVCAIAAYCQISVADSSKEYNFDIQADFRQAAQLTGDDDCVPIKVKVSQKSHLLKSLSWGKSQYFRQFSADGELTETDNDWQWEVPKRGGTLRYCALLANLRGERYDSRITKTWALFRADDLFPPASSISTKTSQSRTTMSFKVPDGWSSVAAYPEKSDNYFEVDNPDRRFDKPIGWVQVGKLGVRRDLVADTQVAVSAPTGEEVTRLEILTLLTFTLPTVRDWFPKFPNRLLVVSASDKMWRGALSGPSSLYLHGERTLVSENATSTVVHELVHVAMERQAADDADWIDEGLAEYMALVLLHQAGGLTDRRFKTALKDQKEWGDSVDNLATDYSSGAATAKAVDTFAKLHNEIGDEHFRQLVKKLAKPGPAISANLLRKYAEDISGESVSSLQ